MSDAIEFIADIAREVQVVLPDAARRPIAIVGAGSIVEVAHLPAYRQLGLRVVAIHDLNGDRARALADRFGIERVADSLDELLAIRDVEVVDIAVLPSAQPGILRRALHAGKHVLTQKPFATTEKQLVELVALVERSGRVVAVNQQLRFDEGFAAARSIVRRGMIGEPTAMHVDVDITTDWSAWPWLIESPRLDLLYHSIHYLDAVRSVLGDPLRVFGTLARRPGQLATGETRSISTLVYGSELRASVVVNHENVGRDPHATFRIDGTAGSVRGSLGMLLDYPNGRPDSLEVYSEILPTDGWLAYPVSRRWIPDAFAGTMASLLNAVADGREPDTSVRDNAGTIRLVIALYRSAETGEAQRLAAASAADSVAG